MANFLDLSHLKTDNPIFWNISDVGNPTFKDLIQVAQNILNILLGITTVLAVIAIIVVGIMFMTSAGDSTKTKKAKDYLKYILLGVAAIVGINLILSFINFAAQRTMP